MPSPPRSAIFCFVLPSLTRMATTAAAPLCPDTINTAGGGIPDSNEPPMVSAEAIKEFQLALFLENMELSYLQSGLQNISTWGTAGYPNDTTEVLSTIAAQEEVHVATIANLLNGYGAPVIAPCQYSFPVASIDEFIALGDIITSVGISALIGLVDRVSYTDPGIVNTVSSIVTVESRHDAFFRHVGGRVPNPAPFDTGISSIWAYNLALPFIVPGSCPTELPLPILPTLTVSAPTTADNRSSAATGIASSIAPYQNTTTSPISTTNTTVVPSEMAFSWDPMQMPFVFERGKQLFVGWTNQLNVPVYTVLSIVGQGRGVADVP
ncbi:hypothetical protein ABEF92_003982 [Exophiala dermatitidis]|uniref:Ferritin-like domain-containing protein n=2 Tax=Exophiala dermatitidis TaxID=5970 RepID=H6BZP4_EXODN|nr:uncharacterized protein HMPREF1120_05148 [Exophiala dermatitidis NIH/UT8656]EHY57098.1 hypothetical protein HMPREF1120_05148 [Exophiala dermatitidis NIH/UT8656]